MVSDFFFSWTIPINRQSPKPIVETNPINTQPPELIVDPIDY